MGEGEEGAATSAFRRAQEELADLPGRMAYLMRPILPGLVSQITRSIQQRVAAYAGSASGRRRLVIEQAVGGATQLFVDILEGRAGSGPRVEELFRRMGRGEAMEGNDLQSMRRALDIATRDAWAQLHRFALGNGLSADQLGAFGDALFAFMDGLGDEVAAGYAAGTAALERDLQRGCDKLLDALLSRADRAEIERLADAIRWVPPAEVIVCLAETTTSHVLPERVPRENGVLARLGRPVSLLVVDAMNGPEALHQARSWFCHGRVVNSWPVPLEEVPDALRWARRALELAELGVLEVGPVVDCDEHLPMLWIHSEPVLRRRLTQQALGPLLEETPHNRQVLAETLMAWLETHASAPALGERLDVHAQTVRYRMRKLRAMFGERLDDPDSALAIGLALKASLPLWRCGVLAEDVATHYAVAERLAGEITG
ncbi:hypothetical protein GCM10011519_08700 [Marmoricola endophyticus]|uniref:PucR family transcriptional regulator n=1 Tax=Marmoricola endophyticus TaxID=2040280 RepID=A0A917BDT2_9ACTN|nr:PucR family transcriptional regulator [Marmoricola endophyticus]GGF37425.1 hypothetical protein GCM10011519_08700 [Marmoricola endophyticus]